MIEINKTSNFKSDTISKLKDNTRIVINKQNLENIILLTNKDIEDNDKLKSALLGKSFNIILVPRTLTNEEVYTIKDCIEIHEVDETILINYNGNNNIYKFKK